MAEVLIDGLFLGGLYALIALGFSMIFKSSRVLNLAYGEQILILSYFLYFLLVNADVPLGLAVPIIFVCGGLFGFLIERLAIRPLMLGFLFKGVIALIWGGQIVPYPFTPTDLWGDSDSVQLRPAFVYSFVSALAIFGLLFFVFRYTKIGLAMRVVAYDHAVSQSLGIKVKRIFSLSWVISGAFAAICAILVGMIFLVAPEMGDIALGKGLPVLLLGGMDSFPGALVGGLIIGVAESLGGYYSPEYQQIVPWILMLLILVIRPWGLFGEQRIERI